MERPTVAVYEEHAREWREQRGAERVEDAVRLREAIDRAAGQRGVPRVDLGCGPGFHAAALGEPVVALDAARSMLDLVPDQAPGASRVQADLEALPFRDRSLGGAMAAKCYLHVAARSLPAALARLHWALRPGSPVYFVLRRGSMEGRQDGDALPTSRSASQAGAAAEAVGRADPFAGRFFAEWEPGPLLDVLAGAGFAVEHDDSEGRWLRLWTRRARTLPDTVASGMRLLVCGLNPSLYAADAGVGFARPGNRFWPAAVAAGLVRRERDPLDALRHGIGMTDLVKRATVAADELTTAEYRDGLTRVERLVRWLRPGAVCFVGLAGWRAAVDRKAVPGVQPKGIGGVPAYVMPSTSGLNAHSRPADLAEHLRAAGHLAGAAD
jgi:TDG/mug DNA glycosylase family protein